MPFPKLNPVRAGSKGEIEGQRCELFNWQRDGASDGLNMKLRKTEEAGMYRTPRVSNRLLGWVTGLLVQID